METAKAARATSENGISPGALVLVAAAKVSSTGADLQGAEVSGFVLERTKNNADGEVRWDVKFSALTPNVQSIALEDLILRHSSAHFRRRKRKLAQNVINAANDIDRQRRRARTGSDLRASDVFSEWPASSQSDSLAGTLAPAADADFPAALRVGAQTWTRAVGVTQDVRTLSSLPPRAALAASAQESQAEESDMTPTEHSTAQLFAMFSWSAQTLQDMVRFTNQRLDKAQKPRLESVHELLKFFGAIIHRAQYPCQTLEDVWQRSLIFRGRSPESFLSLERFRDLIPCLAFAEDANEEDLDEGTADATDTPSLERGAFLASLRGIFEDLNAQRERYVVPGGRLCTGAYDSLGRAWSTPCFANESDDAEDWGAPPLAIRAAVCCESGIVLRLHVDEARESAAQSELLEDAVSLVRPWCENRTLHVSGKVVSSTNASRLWDEHNMYIMGCPASGPAEARDGEREEEKDLQEDGQIDESDVEDVECAVKDLPFRYPGESALYRLTPARAGDPGVMVTGWMSPDGVVQCVVSTCGSSAAGKPLLRRRCAWSDHSARTIKVARDSITAEHMLSLSVLAQHQDTRDEFLAVERAVPRAQWRARLVCSLLGVSVVDAFRAHQLAASSTGATAPSLSTLGDFVAQVIAALLAPDAAEASEGEGESPGVLTLPAPPTAASKPDLGELSRAENAASAHVVKGMTRFNREAKIWKMVNPKLRCSECKLRNRTPAAKTCKFCLTCSLARKGKSAEWASDHVVRLCKDCIPLHYVDGGAQQHVG